VINDRHIHTKAANWLHYSNEVRKCATAVAQGDDCYISRKSLAILVAKADEVYRSDYAAMFNALCGAILNANEGGHVLKTFRGMPPFPSVPSAKSVVKKSSKRST
jgi:hypothetical protein